MQADHHPTTLMDEFAARASVLLLSVPESAKKFFQFIPSEIFRLAFQLLEQLPLLTHARDRCPTSAIETQCPTNIPASATNFSCKERPHPALFSITSRFRVHTSQSHPPRSFGLGKFPTPVGPTCPVPLASSRSITSSH
ncbi:MAG TPA: hypothetical protein VMF91_14660, partial [Bryobacteraceae bacterium]|nr:hypothetical protein [Bryobacteraceae bacterium]